MKRFDKLLAAVIFILIILAVGTNAALSVLQKDNGHKMYRVEISRLCRQLERGEIPYLSACSYLTNIEEYTVGEDFFDSDSSYIIRELNGTLYRFDYTAGTEHAHRIRLLLNGSILVPGGILLLILLYIRRQLLKPLSRLINIPYELSKGNLTVPLTENKSRYFGRFIWGINLLRETMEQQRQRELALQKEKQTLLLSIFHDIKTPLSAIKLYASALSKGLYKDARKQREVSLSINAKADEIEGFVSQLSHTASEDFLQFDVKQGEFYLSEVMNHISDYYTEKLTFNKTEFQIDSFSDCIVTGDIDRGVEVLQNIMENAIKYGDGRNIRIEFSNEEDSRLVTIRNSGCTLPQVELLHIFDSFWRGSNSKGKSGSGLGLYICRQLMLNMEGDIFAEIRGAEMCITVVFRMAD